MLRTFYFNGNNIYDVNKRAAYNMIQYPNLKINVMRGENVESQHQVSAIVVNSKNQTQISWGATEGMKIYPRSSIKPIQALVVILSGALEKFNISDQELAIACASHNGEREHVELVLSWLHRMNLSVHDLECGAHLPSYQKASSMVLQQNKEVTALYNNCSGKHAGFLAAALSLGDSCTKGYILENHPVQKLIREIIEDFCSEKILDSDIAIDGCSIPTYFLHMKNLALAMARLVDPFELPEKYHKASEHIYKVYVENPFYIAGTDRYCTRITSALNKKALVKTGAEGVMFASLPELKLGVVLKAHDGAHRASEAAMSWILKELGQISELEWKNFSQTPIWNWNQIQTGRIFVDS